MTSNIQALVNSIIAGNYAGLAMLYDEIKDYAHTDEVRGCQCRLLHQLIGQVWTRCNRIIDTTGKKDKETITPGRVLQITQNDITQDRVNEIIDNSNLSYDDDIYTHNFVTLEPRSESRRVENGPVNNAVRREARKLHQLIKTELESIFWNELQEPLQVCALIESTLKKYLEK